MTRQYQENYNRYDHRPGAVHARRAAVVARFALLEAMGVVPNVSRIAMELGMHRKTAQRALVQAGVWTPAHAAAAVADAHTRGHHRRGHTARWQATAPLAPTARHHER